MSLSLGSFPQSQCWATTRLAAQHNGKRGTLALFLILVGKLLISHYEVCVVDILYQGEKVPIYFYF